MGQRLVYLEHGLSELNLHFPSSVLYCRHVLIFRNPAWRKATVIEGKKLIKLANDGNQRAMQFLKDNPQFEKGNRECQWTVRVILAESGDEDALTRMANHKLQSRAMLEAVRSERARQGSGRSVGWTISDKDPRARVRVRSAEDSGERRAKRRKATGASNIAALDSVDSGENQEISSQDDDDYDEINSELMDHEELTPHQETPMDEGDEGIDWLEHSDGIDKATQISRRAERATRRAMMLGRDFVSEGYEAGIMHSLSLFMQKPDLEHSKYRHDHIP